MNDHGMNYPVNQHDDDDDDNIGLNALQDAGYIAETFVVDEAYEQGLEHQSDVLIGIMTGGLSAGFAVQLAASYLEKMGTDDIDDMRERVEDKLRDGTLTNLQRDELNDLLNIIKQDPELLNAKK